MIGISNEPIFPKELESKMERPEAGALVTFEGKVRNHNEGKAVNSLEYEVFHELAIAECHRIVKEATERFDLLDVSVVHREGHLQIGDVAVWVGVTARHRDAAFRACRYVIDEVKLRLPIWKKEHYRDEPAAWVNCHGCAHATHVPFEEKDFYEKQRLLPSVGTEGQNRLKRSKVLVVGAGGLGSPALTYLASAGVGEITICDGDRLDPSNLHRQTLYSWADTGQVKAELARRRLADINPFIRVKAITENIDSSNVEKLISSNDVVLDCTDNFETKFLLNDACFFGKVPLVQASIYQQEGQLQIFQPGSGCLRCIWETAPETNCVGSCAEVGVIGAVAGMLGVMQAMETLKVLLGWPYSQSTLLVDLNDWQVTPIQKSRNLKCVLCGEDPRILDIRTEHGGTSHQVDVDLRHLSSREFNDAIFVDIRNAYERNENNPWESSTKHIPGGESDSVLLEMAKKKKRIYLVCAKGARSRMRVLALRKKGAEGVFSVMNGVKALKERWSEIHRC